MLILNCAKLIMKALRGMPLFYYKRNKDIQLNIDKALDEMKFIIREMTPIIVDNMIPFYPNELYDIAEVEVTVYDILYIKDEADCFSIKFELKPDYSKNPHVDLFERVAMDFYIFSKDLRFHYDINKESYILSAGDYGYFCKFEKFLNEKSHLYIHNHRLCIELYQNTIEVFIEMPHTRQLIRIKFFYY